MPECPPGVHSMFDFCPGNCNEPITAREILEGYGLPDGVVDEALVAHAHELAEKIRTKADTFGDWDFTTRRDMRAAADLIDPESDVNRCSGCGDQQDNGQVHGYGAEFGGCV